MYHWTPSLNPATSISLHITVTYHHRPKPDRSPIDEDLLGDLAIERPYKRAPVDMGIERPSKFTRAARARNPFLLTPPM